MWGKNKEILQYIVLACNASAAAGSPGRQYANVNTLRV